MLCTSSRAVGRWAAAVGCQDGQEGTRLSSSISDVLLVSGAEGLGL